MAKHKLVIADMKKDMPPGARDKNVKRDRTGSVILETVDFKKRAFIFEDPDISYEEAALRGAKRAKKIKKEK